MSPWTGVTPRVDNGIRFASFFAKKWLQMIIVFRKKCCDYRDKLNFNFNHKVIIAMIIYGHVCCKRKTETANFRLFRYLYKLAFPPEKGSTGDFLNPFTVCSSCSLSFFGLLPKKQTEVIRLQTD
jgi:hypothetical protein